MDALHIHIRHSFLKLYMARTKILLAFVWCRRASYLCPKSDSDPHLWRDFGLLRCAGNDLQLFRYQQQIIEPPSKILSKMSNIT